LCFAMSEIVRTRFVDVNRKKPKSIECRGGGRHNGAMKTIETILDRMRRDSPELARKYDELREKAIRLDDDDALMELNRMLGLEYWRQKRVRAAVPIEDFASGL